MTTTVEVPWKCIPGTLAMVYLIVHCEMQFSSYWLQRHRAGQKSTPFILIALNNIGQSSWQIQNTTPPFGEWEDVWDQAQDLLSTWLEPLRCNTNPYSHLKFKDNMTWIASNFKKPIRSKVNRELPELFEEKRGKDMSSWIGTSRMVKRIEQKGGNE